MYRGQIGIAYDFPRLYVSTVPSKSAVSPRNDRAIFAQGCHGLATVDLLHILRSTKAANFAHLLSGTTTKHQNTKRSPAAKSCSWTALESPPDRASHPNETEKTIENMKSHNLTNQSQFLDVFHFPASNYWLSLYEY